MVTFMQEETRRPRFSVRKMRAAVLYVALTLAAAVVLFPFFWMLVTALKMPNTVSYATS